MSEEDKYVKRAKRIEKRLKNYSVNSENLVNKFMEDIIFVLDHLTRPNKSDKKKERNLLRFNLLEKLGKAQIKSIVNNSKIENAIKNSLFY